MKNATELLGSINNTYGYVLMALLAIAGLYFSIRTVVVQIRHLPDMMRALVEQPEKSADGKKGISAFRAFNRVRGEPRGHRQYCGGGGRHRVGWARCNLLDVATGHYWWSDGFCGIDIGPAV